MKKHFAFLILVLSLHLACQGSNEPEPLIMPIAYDYYPDYSPDGKDIIFVRLGNYTADKIGGLFVFHTLDTTTDLISA
jgi:hypothetical protein